MEIYCTKQLNGSFIPNYSSDREQADKLKTGEVLRFTIKRPRNYQFHKKYFALIKLGFDNQDQFKNIDRFREAVTIESGYREVKGNIDGSTRVEAKSISFASMDQYEFNDLYKATLNVIISVIGCTTEEIEQNLIDFM